MGGLGALRNNILSHEITNKTTLIPVRAGPTCQDTLNDYVIIAVSLKLLGEWRRKNKIEGSVS